MSLLDKLPPEVIMVGNVSSVSVLIAVILKMLPTIATALTIIWMLILIYESKTYKRVSGWIVKTAKNLYKRIRGKK